MVAVSDAKLAAMPGEPRVTLEYDTIKVYFGDLIHVALQRSRLLGVQSWRNGDRNYAIEYTLAGGSMRTEYAHFEQWAALLRQLDKLELFAA